MRTLSIALCFLTLAACNAERFEPVHIAVYPSTMSCAIKDTPLDCSQLPDYLANTLKVTANREITVSFAGTEEVPKEDKSIDRIAELIRKAGYKNVNVYRFGLK
jgi:hypothetical protein